MRLPRKKRLSIIGILTAVFASFLTLGLVGPAQGQPDPSLCIPVNSGIKVTDDEGVVWVCKCARPVPEWGRVCVWVHDKSTANQRAENGWYVSRATNSSAIVSSLITHHVGGAGNFGQSDVNIHGSSGNRISRPIGARVIVAYLSGSTWQPCHDSNWHYASGSASHYAVREPANCSPHQYRSQAAGTYYSYSLATWLKTPFIYTPSYCIPPGSCGV